MNNVSGFDHYSALEGYPAPGTTWANEMNLRMNHAQVQDQSHDLLTCSPVCYHYAATAPVCIIEPKYKKP